MQVLQVFNLANQVLMEETGGGVWRRMEGGRWRDEKVGG